jgi:hypothetical protein
VAKHQDYLTYSRHGLDNPNSVDEDHRLDKNQMAEELTYTRKWAAFYLAYPKEKVITNMPLNWQVEAVSETAYSSQNTHIVNRQFLKENQKMGYLEKLAEPVKIIFIQFIYPRNILMSERTWKNYWIWES